MKKLLTLACAALISVSALAGNNNSLPLFSFGIKAGYTANQQKFDINTLLSSDAFKKNAAGFNAGIVARMDIPVVPIYVQGELVYDWGKFKGVQLAEGLSTSDVTTNNLSVPVLVGVGIGGCFDSCAFLAKKALTRDVGSRNPRKDVASIEEEALQRINELDIGPQGFGGKTTAIGVSCELAPTHIAGLPVAVNIQCHCVRCEKEVL